MNTQALQQYLHEHIPLSRAMEVQVIHATAEGITLSAPLAPNINHRQTVFGGSASAVAILAAWALLYVRLEQVGLKSRVVIQKNTMYYERPITSAFTAVSFSPDSASWQKFIELLQRKNRARISIAVTLHCDGAQVGMLEGDFVALYGVT